MKTPTDYLDEMSDDSLAEGLTKSDWLDFLCGLRDELDMRISSVQHEVKQEQNKKDREGPKNLNHHGS